MSVESRIFGWVGIIIFPILYPAVVLIGLFSYHKFMPWREYWRRVLDGAFRGIMPGPHEEWTE